MAIKDNTNMDFVELCKTYETKTGSKLTVSEEEKLWGLSATYGNGAVALVLKSLRVVSIHSVARALMQIGGFCDSVPPSLKGLVLSSSEANYKYGQAQIEIARRIQKLVKLLSDPSQAVYISITRDGKTFHQLWQEKSGQTLTEEETAVLTSALLKYGTSMVRRAIEILSGQNVSGAENRVGLFRKWLLAAVEKDYERLEKITKSAGVDDKQINWGLPQTCSLIASLYYEAKAGRELSTDEIRQLNELIAKSSEDDVILSISSVPASEFSMECLIQEHYIRTEGIGGYVEYLLAHKKHRYTCKNCDLQLIEEEPQATDSEIYPNCPDCGSADLESHELIQELPEIEESLIERFKKEDPLGYEYVMTFYNSNGPCDYCASCGHFLQGTKIVTMLSEIQKEIFS